jgi:hypothetical protein
VVGDRTFPVEVTSDAVDYRFDSTETQYAERDLPDDLASKCIEFARSEGLLLAGFDFRRTRYGDWYCLEVNPVPTFLPYEVATGVTIADAVLDEFLTVRHTASTEPPARYSAEPTQSNHTRCTRD